MNTAKEQPHESPESVFKQLALIMGGLCAVGFGLFAVWILYVWCLGAALYDGLSQ